MRIIKCLAERQLRGAGKSSFYHQIGIGEYYDNLYGIKQIDIVVHWTLPEKPHSMSISKVISRTRNQTSAFCLVGIHRAFWLFALFKAVSPRETTCLRTDDGNIVFLKPAWLVSKEKDQDYISWVDGIYSTC